MLKKKIPQIKKDIRNFLNSEEGKITKKNGLKLGTTLAVMGIMLNHTVSAHNSCWAGDCSSDYTNFDGSDCSSYEGSVGCSGNNTNADSGVQTVYHDNNTECPQAENVVCLQDTPGSNSTVEVTDRVFEHETFDNNENPAECPDDYTNDEDCRDDWGTNYNNEYSAEDEAD